MQKLALIKYLIKYAVYLSIVHQLWKAWSSTERLVFDKYNMGLLQYLIKVTITQTCQELPAKYSLCESYTAYRLPLWRICEKNCREMLRGCIICVCWRCYTLYRFYLSAFLKQMKSTNTTSSNCFLGHLKDIKNNYYILRYWLPYIPYVINHLINE